MSERTHYVYRAYDEYGLLLYVGCTCQPKKRQAAHASPTNGSIWYQYACRFVMAGPYEKQYGFATEREQINALEPFFNLTSEQLGYNLRRRGIVQRHMKQLRQDRPDLFAQPGDDPSQLFSKVSVLGGATEEIEREVNRTHPEITPESQHVAYLSARRKKAVTAA